MDRTGQVGFFDSCARRVLVAAIQVAVPLLLVLGMVIPVSAGASTFVVPDLDRLVAMSSAVVRGTVISTTCRRADNGRIVTDYTVAVQEVATGKLDDGSTTMMFTMPGGTVGDVGETVTGLPVFQTGDQVILFVKNPAPQSHDGVVPGHYLVTGMAVGALRVETAIDGTPIVRGLAARAFNRVPGPRSKGIAVSPAPGDANDTAPLDAFLNAVRDAGKGVAR